MHGDECKSVDECNEDMNGENRCQHVDCYSRSMNFGMILKLMWRILLCLCVDFIWVNKLLLFLFVIRLVRFIRWGVSCIVIVIYTIDFMVCGFLYWFRCDISALIVLMIWYCYDQITGLCWKYDARWIVGIAINTQLED